ncbi:pirin family protein [Alkalihalobacillus deserti]|uniref:pirin family protein n=1 Tax=Alkalihalobacillus deserti TaxID=2879466 RepID=UPI001D15223D|nr:pirin family protein [Alkalihalobacillus deserti]
MNLILLIVEDWLRKGTFGFHRHRGIKTVTYLIDHKFEHKDNSGGEGILQARDVQWNHSELSAFFSSLLLYEVFFNSLRNFFHNLLY